MKITELAQREKFEVWAHSHKLSLAYGDCGYAFSSTEMAWRAWMASSAELAEALEKAQQRITQMESRTVTDWIEHDGKWRPESLGLDELVYLKTRKQELKIPYPAGKVKGWMNTGGDMDVMAYKLASPQASTVTVKLPPTIWYEHDDYAQEIAVLEKSRVLQALTAAGIKWEAE